MLVKSKDKLIASVDIVTDSNWKTNILVISKNQEYVVPFLK